MEENSQEQKKNIIILHWKLSNFKNKNSILLETIEDSKWTVPFHHSTTCEIYRCSVALLAWAAEIHIIQPTNYQINQKFYS